MKNRIIRAVLALFIIIFAFSAALTASGVNIDYSRPGSSHTATLYAGDLIEELLSVRLSDAEKRYLRLYCDFSVTLPSSISSSYVSAEYSEDAKTLTLSVKPHVYELSDGTGVKWIPKKAVLWDMEASLTENGGVYQCSFDDVEAYSDNTKNVVLVDFEYDISISAEAFNSFLNKAYFDIPSLREEHQKKTEEYENACLLYEKNKVEYAEYLKSLSEYNAQYALYEKYLEEKRVYDEKYAEFERYKEDLKKYNDDLIAYGVYEKALEQYEADYISYLRYLDNAEKYDEEMSKYQKYLLQIETVRAQLKVLDQIKTSVTPLKRSTYGDIMGGTVTSVIDNKTLIVKTFGVKAEVVDLAGDATESLRELFTDYFSFKEERDKYAYYVMNCESFRDNFSGLLRALDSLYHNEGVTDTLRTQEKEEKYVILLAQLYKITNALTDGTVYSYDGTYAFDQSYKIQNFYSKFPQNDSFYDKYVVSKKPSEVITEEDYYVDSESSEPLAGGYPNEVIEPEILVTEEPVRPAYMKTPAEPEEVAEPEPITEVKEPTKPGEVFEMAEPEKYVADEAILGIIDENFTLTLRDEIKSDFISTKRISVKKQFIGAESVGVVFHDNDGNEIFSTPVDKGTMVDFYGKLPTKAEDEGATYEFECWVDEFGVEQSLETVEKDMFLYPRFKKILKQFEITWIIEDTEIKQTYDYGALPLCPIIPQKNDTLNTYFTFDGFDIEPTAVTKNASYTAKFKENYYVAYSNGLGASISYEDGECTVDASKNDDTRYDISSLVTKIAGKYSLKILTRYGDVSFSYSDTVALKKEGIGSFALLVNMVGNGSYEYKISLYNSSGEESVGRVSATLDLPCRVPDAQRMILYYYSNEEKKPVSYTLDGASVRFKAGAGTKYFAGCEYSVTVIPCEELAFSADKKTAMYGSTVYVSFTPKKGIEINGTYYVRENGERVYFEGCFTLNENVTVGIDYRYTEYTVVFVSDGKIISSNTYRYGDMPVSPPNPKKPSDDKYSYKFIGWSQEIVPVSEDKTYEARYWSSPVLKEPEKLIQIADGIMRYILLGSSLVFILLFGGVPCVIISVKNAKKRKKARK